MFLASDEKAGLGSLMAGRAGLAARLAELPTLQGGRATKGVWLKGGRRRKSSSVGLAPFGVGSSLEGRLGSAAAGGGVLAKLGTEAARWAN